MRLQKRSYPSPFPTVEAIAVNNVNRLQLSLKFVSSSKDMHMCRSMFVRMNHNIVSVPLAMQNRYHCSMQL